MKNKVLILDDKIWDYRIDIYNLLNEKYDLTIAFDDKKYIGKKYSFKTIYTPGFKFGPFFLHSANLFKIARRFDVVIAHYDIRILTFMALTIPKRKYRLLLWGIGVTASYENRFDSKQTWDKVRYFFGKKADALIFYSDYPIKKFIRNGFDPEKLYVAGNTVAVSEMIPGSPEQKMDLLFVGTLYKEKGIEMLIDSYIKLFEHRSDIPKLRIIGGGPLEAEIRQIVTDKNMSGKIELTGPIYDKDILKEYFRQSIVCISPNQAGLSVLTSMGYGVPYLTSENAITGGELFNIEHKVNGLIYDGRKENLTKTLAWIIDNKSEMIKMGINAWNFYYSKRKPENMARSIEQAIEYSLG